ncbi:hypothetical protein MP228_002730 [Amoeboaphelidium protococcarum]|nr:hypothetical protein MP228_002730 [Amoeboaphelidium protococcarum]
MLYNSFLLCLIAISAASCIKTNDNEVPGEYIVSFKNEYLSTSSNDAFIDDHLHRVFGLAASAEPTYNPIMHKYSFGYAAKMDDYLIDMVRDMPEVDVVEQNKIGHIFGEQSNPKNWGLTRISQRLNDKNHQSYPYPDHAGKGTTVYIIDSGIDVKHSEFQRSGGSTNARHGISFYVGVDTDDNGHGTHVASTVGGLLSGVAKSAEVVAVKVCGGNGRCFMSDIVGGVEFAIKDRARRGRSEVDIANMSLGFPGESKILERAMQIATDSGILFAVAAGNEYGDACYSLPAAYDFVLTVAASDVDDKIAKFSNRGRCCNLFAPGKDILAATPGNKFQSFSGTSMASPHVAGALALLASSSPSLNVDELKGKLLDLATPNVIKLSRSDKSTPNKLLFVPSN